MLSISARLCVLLSLLAVLASCGGGAWVRTSGGSMKMDPLGNVEIATDQQESECVRRLESDVLPPPTDPAYGPMRGAIQAECRRRADITLSQFLATAGRPGAFGSRFGGRYGYSVTAVLDEPVIVFDGTPGFLGSQRMRSSGYGITAETSDGVTNGGSDQAAINRAMATQLAKLTLALCKRDPNSEGCSKGKK